MQKNQLLAEIIECLELANHSIGMCEATGYNGSPQHQKALAHRETLRKNVAYHLNGTGEKHE